MNRKSVEFETRGLVIMHQVTDEKYGFSIGNALLIQWHEKKFGDLTYRSGLKEE